MKVLLHICCSVCAASVVERLMCEGHKVTGFFYNPNIHPVDEYNKRLDAVREVARQFDFELVEGVYDRENWFPLVKGMEYEPEGSRRCAVCFDMRLKKTYEYCQKNMFDAFTTTLTVSRFKNAVLINDIGRAIGGERFITADFKKKGGFERAMQLANEWKLYHQNYCGCIYSLEARLRDEERFKAR